MKTKTAMNGRFCPKCGRQAIVGTVYDSGKVEGWCDDCDITWTPTPRWMVYRRADGHEFSASTVRRWVAARLVY